MLTVIIQVGAKGYLVLLKKASVRTFLHSHPLYCLLLLCSVLSYLLDLLLQSKVQVPIHGCMLDLNIR